MIAGSVANNVGFNARQLHLIPVEKGADCWFVGFQLHVVTRKPLLDDSFLRRISRKHYDAF